MVEQNNKIMENLKKRNSNQKLNENSKEKSQEFIESDQEQVKKFIRIYKEMLKYIKNIQWAPLNIPLRRRLQTLAVSIYVFIFMGLPFVCVLFTLYMAIYWNYIVRSLVFLYVAYFIYDHKFRYSDINGNGFLFLRNNCWTKHLRDYFPVKLIKTAELTPDRNYLFACFPHGIMGTSVSINMGYDIAPWLKTFPGIRPKIATLDSNLYLPLMREVCRFYGLVSCSKESLTYYLTKSNDPKHKDNKDGFTSNAVALLVGGAQESLYARPGNNVLQLKNRKGFVKIAIRTGSPIVPTFTFGEVEIYDQVPNPPESLVRKLQTFVKKLTGVSPVIVLGRGFFQYTFGFLPHRKHLVQVVGSPIEVEKQSNPSPEYVDEIHQKVIDSLNDIFEKYKFKYIENPQEAKLVIN